MATAGRWSGIRSSLRARLAAWLLLPLSVFVLVCAFLSWRNAATVADYVQDRDLLSSAKVLSDASSGTTAATCRPACRRRR